MQLDGMEARIGQSDHQPGPRSGVPVHHCIEVGRNVLEKHDRHRVY
jgi:hypothetical protein